jgi:hypothetical protein
MRPVWLDKIAACTFFVVLGLAVGCNGIGAQPPASASLDSGAGLPFTEAQILAIPSGTAVYVRLQETISSRTAQAGQSFSAVLDEPLLVNGQTVAPEGAEIKGRIVAARESGQLRDAGYLRLTLASITLGGKDMPLQTSSVFVEGGSFNKRNFAYIGGGAGGGALIGALAAGGRGALVGTALGAAGGTAAAYATGKKEVGFLAERRLGFRLTQPLDVDAISKSVTPSKLSAVSSQ